MADPLRVQIVAADRAVWSGTATLVTFVTAEGSIGIMPGHSPLLATLQDGPVLIRQVEGGDVAAAVHTGFALVDSGEVLILGASAELASEIDIERARAALERAKAGEAGLGRDAAEARAETRLKTVAEV